MSEFKLQLGEYVHYGQHGICRVCSLETRTISRKDYQYFLLKPVSNENIELLLPVNAKPEKVGVRNVMNENQILQLVEAELEHPVEWISDSKARKEALGRIIRDGDTEKLIRVVKAMQARREALPEGKTLPLSDEEYAKQAEKQLYDEFGFVLHLSRDQIVPFVLGKYKPQIAQTAVQ